MLNKIPSLNRSFQRAFFVSKAIVLTLALLWSQSTYTPVSGAAGTVTKSVRWHPGNYVLVWSHCNADQITAALRDGRKFRGIQKQYFWNDLEKPDGFHFDEIGDDLRTLRRLNKHLVIQLQCKAFFTTADGKPNTSCPANLRGSAKPGGGYYSGTYVTRTGSLGPVIWDPAVTARMRTLYRELSRYLNANPNVQALEAVCLSETAVSQDPDAMPNDVMPYSTEAYANNLSYGFRELSNALPHTVVIQYTNFGVGLDIIDRIVQMEKAAGVGLGGPDLDPFGHDAIQAPRGVYQQYINLAGDWSHPNAIPMGTAVQMGDTDPAPEQTYLFGKNTLHLNYIFWIMKPGYIDSVTRMLSDPRIVPQNDPAGGLDSRYPNSTSPYLN